MYFIIVVRLKRNIIQITEAADPLIIVTDKLGSNPCLGLGNFVTGSLTNIGKC